MNPCRQARPTTPAAGAPLLIVLLTCCSCQCLLPDAATTASLAVPPIVAHLHGMHARAQTAGDQLAPSRQKQDSDKIDPSVANDRRSPEGDHPPAQTTRPATTTSSTRGVVRWMNEQTAATQEVRQQIGSDSSSPSVAFLPSPNIPIGTGVARGATHNTLDNRLSPYVHTGDTPQPDSAPRVVEMVANMPAAASQALADEYLCDGGDQQAAVRVGRNWNVRGLDLEDTVGHYDTLDGRTLVSPSNSVCLYAPRFAAVRKIVQTSQNEKRLVMHEVNQPTPTVTDERSNQPQHVEQPVPSEYTIGLHAPLGLRHRVRGLDVLHALPVAELAKNFQAHEDFQVVHNGIHRTSQRAMIEQYAVAATTWTDNLAPKVMLDSEPAQVDVTVEKSASIHHLGMPSSPKLRVIKLASDRSAQPGEEVTFTLRFDNVGDQTIGNVTILDNLTTRLEYVPSSAECDLEANFFHDPNQGESLTLRWEIEEPIRPGHGGIIRFRCKVR